MHRDALRQATSITGPPAATHYGQPMKLTTVAAVALLFLLPLAACGDDEPDTSGTPTTTATSAAPTTTVPTADAASSADLELGPGRVGPVEVGMTKAQAVATGLFDADVDRGEGETCGGVQPLLWKDRFKGVDVLTDDQGTIVSMGVTSAGGPRTKEGFGVGTRFGELIEVYGGDLGAPEAAGYGQVGVYVQDDDAWLGYLFGDADSVEKLDNDPGLEVTFVEVTRGDKPGLMRDGC